MRSWRPIVKMPGTSLSASKRVVGPRQAGLLAPDHCRWAPSQGTASVDLAHGSSVTVTGSRRIRTGFPFQLSSSHLSVVLNLWTAWPASPPPKGDRIIGCGARPQKKTPPESLGRRRSVTGGALSQATRDCSKYASNSSMVGTRLISSGSTFMNCSCAVKTSSIRSGILTSGV
jgi:hypothetical protein